MNHGSRHGVTNLYHGDHNDVRLLLSCRARVRSLLVLKLYEMVSKENANPLDLAAFQLPPKKKCRFKRPATKEEMATLSKGFVPANTKKNTTWAYKVFWDWRAERNWIRSGKQHGKTLWGPY